MYKLIKRENHARRGELQTVHGTVQTPAFMNVATAAAIKGAVSAYGSTIAMAFDECVENPAEYDYAKNSCARTARWLRRCKAEMNRLNALPDTINPNQMLFGINQGCTYIDLRVNHMKEIAELGLDGYAIGGLAVGEPAEVMYEVIEAVEEHMPQDKIRYLMGVGTPTNILEAVHRGVDLFDCVMPSRNARHGHA